MASALAFKKGKKQKEKKREGNKEKERRKKKKEKKKKKKRKRRRAPGMAPTEAIEVVRVFFLFKHIPPHPTKVNCN